MNGIGLDRQHGPLSGDDLVQPGDGYRPDRATGLRPGFQRGADLMVYLRVQMLEVRLGNPHPQPAGSGAGERAEVF